MNVSATVGPNVPATPAVSVVIPTHRPVWLDAALESVRAQTFIDYEIIVVDDGSPEPATPGRADDLTVIRQPNAGAAAARNRGLAHARGEFVAFLDHDDLWLPGKLARQVDFHRAHPDVILTCTDVGRLEAPDEAPLLARHGHAEGGFPFEDLLRENCLGTSAVTVRTDAARRVGGFDETQRYTEDYRFWLELGLIGPLAFLPEVLCLWRTADQSVTAGGRAAGVWQAAEIEVYTKFLAAHPEWRGHPAVRDGLARAALERGYAMLQRGAWCEARRALLASIKQRPWRRRTWLNLARASLHARPAGG
jgi:glycosyltransferase involved in cell wall biosynthesis